MDTATIQRTVKIENTTFHIHSSFGNANLLDILFDLKNNQIELSDKLKISSDASKKLLYNPSRETKYTTRSE